MNTIEKVRQLEQYISMDQSSVDPVIHLTINKLLSRETTRLLELKQRMEGQLDEFEKRYQLSSPDFYQKYEKGDMGDDMDYMEWASTFKMEKKIEQKLSLLKPDSTL